MVPPRSTCLTHFITNRPQISPRCCSLDPLLFCFAMEITAQQASILDRLRAQDFQIVAFPMYENYVGVRKGNCAALLAPQGSGGFGIYGQPTYLVGGNLSAKMLQGD